MTSKLGGPALPAVLVALWILLSACDSTTRAPDDPRAYRPDFAPADPADTVLFTYDRTAPLDVRETSRVTEDGVTVVDLSFASPKGGRVGALLVLPPGTGPHPALLAMHGLPGNRHQMLPALLPFAGRGVASLVLDAPHARREGPPVYLDERDRAEQIQLVVDLRRGVDLLHAREDIDPVRTGYLGISYGGAMGGLLAGVERRLDPYLLVVGDGGLITHFTGPDDADGPLATLDADARKRWIESMWPIEPWRWVGRAAPATLYFQNGRRDRLVPEADALLYQEAASEPKVVRWYDAGHGLDDSAVQDRLDWLETRFTLDDESPPGR